MAGPIDRIVDLFRTRREPPRARRPRSAKPASPSPRPQDEFLNRLKRTMLERSSMVAGKLHFVNFDALQQRLGERWPALSDRVFALAESLISQTLTSQDIFSRVGETSFVVVFGNLSKEEAQVKCGLIVDQVYKRLLGEHEWFKDVTIETVVAELDGSMIFESMNLFETLSTALDAARLSEVGTAAAAAAAGAHGSEPEAGKAAGKDAAPASSKVHFIPEDLHFSYVPMWDARRGAISTYLCTPRARRNGRLVSGYAVLPGDTSSTATSELDCLVLGHGLTDLIDLAKAKVSILVAVTVHCRTIEDYNDRERYLSVLRELPADLRRLLVFEVVGFPLGVPESRVAFVTSALKPFSRAIVVRCWIGETNLNSLQYLGIRSVSSYFGDCDVPESDLALSLNKFYEAAARAGFLAVAHGLRTKSLVALAVGAGFDYVDGEAISSAAERPGTVAAFDLLDVYRAGGNGSAD